jgi:hypothetical protein
MDTYSLQTQDRAEEYFRSKGININILFSGPYQKKKNSVAMADAIFEMWKQRLLSPQLLDSLTINNKFGGLVMSNLLSNVVSTADELRLSERIENLITEYVDVVDVATINVPFVADLIASTINNFVCDLGFSCRSDEQKQTLIRVAKERNLSIFNYIDKEDDYELTEETITNLFARLNSSPDAITPAYEQNYFTWSEYVVISFIAKVDVGLGNPVANRELRVLIDKLS